MRRAGLVAAGIVGLLAVAIAGVALVVLRDTAEPVTVGEAIDSFRGETGASRPESPIPEGVYVYATAGFEKTDALTGVTHRYPKRSTITIRARDCGVSLLWRVLKGRTTEWVYCTTPDGWELASQDERHTFFGRTEPTTYVCESTFIRPAQSVADIRAGLVDCGTDDAREQGQVVALGSPTLEVGTARRDTIHVKKSTTFSGAIRGTADYDFWFDEEAGVPVRIVMVSRTTNDSPVGDVHYEERVSLRLTSLTPRR
jgi:hypothetical protein